VTRTGLKFLELFLQPGAIAFDEGAGLGLRAAARNRHAGGAVRPQSQQVAPGPQMAHHEQRHHPGTEEQRLRRILPARRER